MSRFEDFVAAARAGLNLVAEVQELLRSSRAKWTEAGSTLHGLTEESSSEKLPSSVANLDAALDALDRAEANATSAVEAFNSYLADIGATGGSSSPGDRQPSADLTPSFRPAPAYDPAKAREIEPFAERQKTVGRAYDERGQPIGELIWSGWDGAGRGGSGLKDPWAKMDTLTKHVEGHVAAIMRRERHLKDVTIYSNREPCDYIPNGCVYRIEEALPPDTRLTVFSSDRRRRPTIFKGNGKGLADETV